MNKDEEGSLFFSDLLIVHLWVFVLPQAQGILDFYMMLMGIFTIFFTFL